MATLLKRAHNDITNEEKEGADLRRQIDALKDELRQAQSIASRAERAASELRTDLSTLEKQHRSAQQDRTAEISRLEKKITHLRSQKNEVAKNSEKLRLRLRSAQREKAELEHQLHVARSEEEWSRRELEHLKTPSKSENMIPHARGPLAVETSARDVEQLRRENSDLQTSVASLTKAMQRLTGGKLEHATAPEKQTDAKQPQHKLLQSDMGGQDQTSELEDTAKHMRDQDHLRDRVSRALAAGLQLIRSPDARKCQSDIHMSATPETSPPRAPSWNANAELAESRKDDHDTTTSPLGVNQRSSAAIARRMARELSKSGSRAPRSKMKRRHTIRSE